MMSPATVRLLEAVRAMVAKPTRTPGAPPKVPLSLTTHDEREMLELTRELRAQVTGNPARQAEVLATLDAWLA